VCTPTTDEITIILDGTSMKSQYPNTCKMSTLSILKESIHNMYDYA